MDIEKLCIKIHKDGLTIGVITHPQSNENRINGIHDGMLKIDVTAPPEKGKANEAVVKLLSKELGVPKSSIEILSGETSRKKVVLIKGMDLEALKNILREIIPNR